MCVLQELRLGHNKLKVLPASMGQMLEMKSIDISHNRFEDFPQMLTKMVSLEQINVAFNLLSALPVELATLKNLVTIYCLMNRCKVTSRSYLFGDLKFLSSMQWALAVVGYGRLQH